MGHPDPENPTRFHHVEFWCGDATNAALRFSWGLGLPLVAKSDLSTDNHSHASFLFSAPYSQTLADPTRPDPTRPASIPSFNHSAFSAKHGLADDDLAFRQSVAEVQLYGDAVLRYISYNDSADVSSDPAVWFLPGFEAVTSSFPLDFGLRRLGHAVVNVPNPAAAVEYVKSFTSFHEFSEFTADEVGTGMNSAVLACNDENVLFPMMEPVYGTKRKSQIQTFLEHNEGPGVQHLALVS